MKAQLLSAGVIVVRFADDKTPRYLILRAYRNWDFPKGLVEPGEAPFDGAQREVAEETGLRNLVFRWGEDYRETAPYGHQHKIARYYLAESPDGEAWLPVNPDLGRPEHEEFRWVTYDNARLLLPPRLQPMIRWAHGVVGGAA